MSVIDYRQTKSKEEAIAFINATKEDSIYEVVVRGEKQDLAKAPNVDVYIDGELAYTLRPDEGKFWERNVGEFYLSKSEGWQLCKYLENYAEGGITPSWWTQADKNIRRHRDPMFYFRHALDTGLDIDIKFVE